jgi:hypothetical protein
MSDAIGGSASPHSLAPPGAGDPADTPPDAAARGVLLALLLSAPVWIGVGLAVWRLAVADPG